MSQTNIATQTPVGPYPAGGAVAALGLDLVWTAADASNGNKFPFTGKEVLLVQNTDTGSQTVTLTSVADSRGRSDDVTAYAVAAGVISAFNFRGGAEGWQQPSDQSVHLAASSALIKYAILRIP